MKDTGLMLDAEIRTTYRRQVYAVLLMLLGIGTALWGIYLQSWFVAAMNVPTILVSGYIFDKSRETRNNLLKIKRVRSYSLDRSEPQA